MKTCKTCDVDTLLRDIKAGGLWRVIISVNFEECSIDFLIKLLKILDPGDITRVELEIFRFGSTDATEWSLLEILKDNHVASVKEISAERKIRTEIKKMSFPLTEDHALELLNSNFKTDYNLVLDFSAMPKKAASYISDIVFGSRSNDIKLDISESYFIITDPEISLERNGIGPFSVGDAKVLYSPFIVNEAKRKGRLSLLVMPGIEGFEAKHVIDSLKSENTEVSVLFPFTESSLVSGRREILANQAVISDWNQGLLNCQFYFSDSDIIRAVDEIVEKSVERLRSGLDEIHCFAVAPFGAKWGAIISSYARSRFLFSSKKYKVNTKASTDVLTLGSSQYVSVHSIGTANSRCFLVK